MTDCNMMGHKRYEFEQSKLEICQVLKAPNGRMNTQKLKCQKLLNCRRTAGICNVGKLKVFMGDAYSIFTFDLQEVKTVSNI